MAESYPTFYVFLLKSADGRCPVSQTLGRGWSYVISVLGLPREHPLLCISVTSRTPASLRGYGTVSGLAGKKPPFHSFFSLPQNKTSFFHLPPVQYLRSPQNLQPEAEPENRKKVWLFESHASWKFVFLLVSVKIQQSSEHPLEFFALWAYLVVLKSVTFRAQVS